MKLFLIDLDNTLINSVISGETEEIEINGSAVNCLNNFYGLKVLIASGQRSDVLKKLQTTGLDLCINEFVISEKSLFEILDDLVSKKRVMLNDQSYFYVTVASGNQDFLSKITEKFPWIYTINVKELEN